LFLSHGAMVGRAVLSGGLKIENQGGPLWIESRLACGGNEFLLADRVRLGKVNS
jgi:hypothetical protein